MAVGIEILSMGGRVAVCGYSGGAVCAKGPFYRRLRLVESCVVVDDLIKRSPICASRVVEDSQR
jgi:hypothetical protein